MFPNILGNRATDGADIVSLTRLSHFTLQEDSWYPFLLEVESTPRAMVWLEELGQLKNPMTSSGIEPPMFLLVA
jgi:hypothetical protein